MNQFSAYKEWRAKGAKFPFADDIYIEVRTVNEVDRLVGFIGVDDKAETPEQIGDRRNAVWASLEMKLWALQQLSHIAPSRMVFTDAGMSVFEVHSSPFGLDDYVSMTPYEYQSWIEGLGGVELANRTAPQPDYPDKMSRYSLWHYRLDYVCKCRDIDYIEIRTSDDDLSIRAFLEVTGNLEDENHIRNSERYIFQRLALQQVIVRLLAGHYGVEGFLVIHDKSLSVFCIYDMTFRSLATYTQAEYKGWLKSL